MLAVPDATAHITKIADWLELTALSSSNGRVGFGTLTAAMGLSAEGQSEDIEEEDLSNEALVLSAQNELTWRLRLIGSDYPFRMDENGQSMQLVTHISEPGSAYLLCLFLSHANDRTIIPEKLAPKITDKVRDLFQACATVAAGGYVQGTAISFGWPRPDGTTFLQALRRAYKLFGDGTPHRRARPAASKFVKDNGIDVIAWRPSPDELPGTHYLLGQAASGQDWVGKSVKTDSLHFHNYWFSRPPASQHQDAIFIPFCLEPPPPGSGVSYEDVLKDHVQSLMHKYGVVFYRYRIAKFVADGMRLQRGKGQTIERVQDFPEVLKWVRSYRKRLLNA